MYYNKINRIYDAENLVPVVGLKDIISKTELSLAKITLINNIRNCVKMNSVKRGSAWFWKSDETPIPLKVFKDAYLKAPLGQAAAIQKQK